MTYKCPHCGKPIQEVSIVELNAKQLIVSAMLGFGVGVFTWPLFGQLSAVGGFVVAFLITFLFLRRK